MSRRGSTRLRARLANSLAILALLALTVSIIGQICRPARRCYCLVESDSPFFYIVQRRRVWATFIFLNSPHGKHEEPLAEPAFWRVRHSSAADWSGSTPISTLWARPFCNWRFCRGGTCALGFHQSPSSLPIVSSFPSVVIKDTASAASVYFYLPCSKFRELFVLTSVSWQNVSVLACYLYCEYVTFLRLQSY